MTIVEEEDKIETHPPEVKDIQLIDHSQETEKIKIKTWNQVTIWKEATLYQKRVLL